MAQSVAVVTQSLTATLSGTTDFTSSGFGTPTAAIVIMTNANTTNNPQSGSSVSVGFWDGTNQRAMAIHADDAATTTATLRASRTDVIALGGLAGSSWNTGYSCSATTDGIRLTMSVDNSGASRYCTVILLAGVSAKVLTFTPNATQNATQASASLGFAPSLLLATTIGFTGSTAASGSSQTTNAILSFGAASSDGTHRMMTWASDTAAADAVLTQLFSETRFVGQTFSGTTAWGAEVTTWGADTFTTTTRDGASGSDICYVLALGGADLSFDLGTLTTSTSAPTVAVDTTTTVDPDALLLVAGGTDNAGTIVTDSRASSFSIGVTDGTNEYGFALVDEDAAGTTNAEAAYSSTKTLYLRTSASGTASTLVEADVSLATAKFTTSYTTTSGTARKAWWLAFGAATGGGSSLDLSASALSISGAVTTTGNIGVGVDLSASALSVSGTVSVSGDIQIGTAASLDLSASALSLSGTASVSGDLGIGTAFDLAASAVSVSGTVSIAGDLAAGTGLNLSASPITVSGTLSLSGDILAGDTPATVRKLENWYYRPALVPFSAEAWLVRELNTISRSTYGAAPFVQMVDVTVEPDKPNPGMVVFTTATAWDPGSGAGVYCYRSGAWHLLG